MPIWILFWDVCVSSFISKNRLSKLRFCHWDLRLILVILCIPGILKSRVIQSWVPFLIKDIKRPSIRPPLIWLSHVWPIEVSFHIINPILAAELSTLGLTFRFWYSGIIDRVCFCKLISDSINIVAHIIKSCFSTKFIFIFASLHQILNFFHYVLFVLIDINAIQGIINIILLPEEALITWHLPARHVKILFWFKLANLWRRHWKRIILSWWYLF